MSSLLNQKGESHLTLLSGHSWACFYGPCKGSPRVPSESPGAGAIHGETAPGWEFRGAPRADPTACRDTTGAKSRSQDKAQAKSIFSARKNSPNTMFGFLMEGLGCTFRGHSIHFLNHPKVGGLGISSWFLYLTGGASIAQSQC